LVRPKKGAESLSPKNQGLTEASKEDLRETKKAAPGGLREVGRYSATTKKKRVRGTRRPSQIARGRTKDGGKRVSN